jgi:hypothetical protein
VKTTLRRGAALAVALSLTLAPLTAAPGLSSIESEALREWITYLASDELEGRATYSSGLGLAAGYIQERLRGWGVAPGGDRGTYIQTVRVRAIRADSRSSVTVRVNGASRTFKDGEGVRFPRNAGGRQTLVVDRVEFAGYGLDLPAIDHSDFRNTDVKGAAVVWLGQMGPKAVDAQLHRRLLTGRARYATEQLFALASVGPDATTGSSAGAEAVAAGGRGGGSTGNDRGPGSAAAVDFTTAQRLDAPLSPAVSASDEFFEFLFSAAPVAYGELKRKAGAQEPLPTFRLSNVTLTFNVDHEYAVVRTQLTQNIVGIVRGSDPALSRSYVAFGAHYDHVGYAEGELAAGGSLRGGAPGRVTPGALDDRIWNGADDDASGTAALMAIARAFAEGPRPKRSLLFVWHAGEERGLLGSRYFADHPTVPLDAIVAQLNVDMIGRNRDDKVSESDTVYLIGSDRISSELHEIGHEANRALPEPLTLDYEMNDPADREQVYYRSDHYSYAVKGIPIIFFTTGLHPDYHTNTDHVDKIEFPKLTRITQLIYEIGARVANLDHAPVRDHKGPRAGR